MNQGKTEFGNKGLYPAFFTNKYFSFNSTLEHILLNLHSLENRKFNSLKCIHDVANGMCYLHNNLCIHGNLCPFNIIYNGRDYQIWNYGLNPIYTLYLDDNDICDNLFRSPNLKNCDNVSFKDDIYSFGVLMAYIFIKTNDTTHFKHIPKQKIDIGEIKQSLGANKNNTNFEMLIYNCLNDNPVKCPSFEDIVNEINRLTSPASNTQPASLSLEQMMQQYPDATPEQIQQLIQQNLPK